MQIDFRNSDTNNENSALRSNNFIENSISNPQNSVEMDNSDSSANARSQGHIVREGWLYKRSEHLKSWRPRYFYLFSNGDFLGYKSKPNSANMLMRPLNNFTVRKCEVIKTEKPRQFSFIFKGIHWKEEYERKICADTLIDREKWCHAIESVRDSISENNSDQMEQESMGQDLTGRANISTKNPSSTDKKTTLDDFEFLKLLGKGTFGKVILCREKSSGGVYAIKVLNKEAIIEKNETRHTVTEMKVLHKCKHPFLITMKYAFETGNRFCFLLEFINGGELFYHLTRERTFSEDRTRFYSAEILLALEYLHSHGIIYRDLKLENLLIDKDGHIKIADFGLCKEGIGYKDRTDTFCGTPEYLSCEMLISDQYGRAVDWWGLGVVMYEMMTGRPPFYSHDHERLFQSILEKNVRFPSTMSSEAINLLEGLLEKDPQKRLGGGEEDAQEIKMHPFFISVDWDRLLAKEIEPSFIPQVTSETDTRYFDEEFTKRSVELTPPIDDLSMVHFTQFSFHDSKSSFTNH